MGSNWVSLLIDCVRILTPQRHFVWINGDENNDDDDHDGEANFCLCLRFYGVFTFVLNLVGSIVQVYILKTAQEKNKKRAPQSSYGCNGLDKIRVHSRPKCDLLLWYRAIFG